MSTALAAAAARLIPTLSLIKKTPRRGCLPPVGFLPLLFLGQEIVRQREGGDNALNTSNHPLDVPPNSDSSSGESSDAGDESIPPSPTLPPSPWRNSTAKANIIKALKDETSDIHLFIGAFGPNNWKEVIFE